jgi:4-hydroxybenzoate polyprenyltransferase
MRISRSAQFLKLLQVSRPGLWIVFIWLYLWPTGGRRDLLSSPSFWIGFVYATFPLNLLVYGMNDLVDEDVDKSNPRKGNYIYGAKITKRDRAYLPNVILVSNLIPHFVMGFVTREWLFLSVWLLGAFSVNFLYNNRPFQFSRKFPFEVPTMVVGHLMIPLLACRINKLALPGMGSWIFNILLLVRSHIWLEFADIACDEKEGKRTFAVVFGPKVAFRTVIFLTVLESLSAYFLLKSIVLSLFSLFGVVVFSLSTKEGKVKEEKVHVSVSQSVVGAMLMMYIWKEAIFLN